MKLQAIGFLTQIVWLPLVIACALDRDQKKLARWTMVVSFVGIALCVVSPLFEIFVKGGLRLSRYQYARGSGAVIGNLVLVGAASCLQLVLQHKILGPSLQEYERTLLLGVMLAAVIAVAHSLVMSREQATQAQVAMAFAQYRPQPNLPVKATAPGGLRPPASAPYV